MANKYVNIEEIGKILHDGKLGELAKKASSAERSVQDILKKLSDLESAQTAKKLEEELRLAQEIKAATVCSMRYTMVSERRSRYISEAATRR